MLKNKSDLNKIKVSDSNGIRTHDHLVPKRTLNHSAKLANDWNELWVLICMVHLIVSYYHVTYEFQSDSILYNFLNVKELLARNRRYTWSLSESNGIRTHNHLVLKQTLNHLAKMAKCVVTLKLVRDMIITDKGKFTTRRKE